MSTVFLVNVDPPNHFSKTKLVRVRDVDVTGLWRNAWSRTPESSSSHGHGFPYCVHSPTLRFVPLGSRIWELMNSWEPASDSLDRASCVIVWAPLGYPATARPAASLILSLSTPTLMPTRITVIHTKRATVSPSN